MDSLECRSVHCGRIRSSLESQIVNLMVYWHLPSFECAFDGLFVESPSQYSFHFVPVRIWNKLVSCSFNVPDHSVFMNCFRMLHPIIQRSLIGSIVRIFPDLYKTAYYTCSPLAVSSVDAILLILHR